MKKLKLVALKVLCMMVVMACMMGVVPTAAYACDETEYETIVPIDDIPDEPVKIK